MKRLASLLLLLAATAMASWAQELNQIDDEGNITTVGKNRKDSLNKHQEVPRGFYVWTVDRRFGDRIPAQPDTLQHMYMNTIFTEGVRGSYNTLGNIGSPRISRIFIDRQEPAQFMFTQPYDFFITEPDQFHFTNTLSPITNLTYQECGDKQNGEDHLKASFAINAGKRIGLGLKFNYIYGRGYYADQSTALFNYTMYGSYLGDRYQAHLLMSTNHQKMAENGGIADDEYILHPEKYQESFETDEIPTFLSEHWNRNDHHHIFFTHRYNIGFNRKVPMTEKEIEAKKFAMASAKEQEERKAMEQARRKARRNGEEFDEEAYKSGKHFEGRPDGARIAGPLPTDNATAAPADSGRIAVEGQASIDSINAAEARAQEDTSWLKNEYVPVTSIIHTLNYDYARRIYQAYDTPADYYATSSYYADSADVVGGDSIYDVTRHFRLHNTFALALFEGFNKWAKAGLKAFVASDYRHFALPNAYGHHESYNEHSISIGGQLSKTQGHTVHYNATVEAWLAGEDAGQLKVDGRADLNIPLFGDTVRLAANAFFHRLHPTFYQRHFHSRHAWWDNDLDKETRTHIEGRFSFPKTKTMLRVAADNIANYTYFAQSYAIADETSALNSVAVEQASDNITLFTLQLRQDFSYGIFHWENEITYQKSSSETVLAVPTLNIYSNLYLNFRIARVLHVNLGADVRYFTKYYAPDYSPLLGQFTVQNNGDNNVKVGNYPWVNVYANFKLKQARFYVMMSHVNYKSGNSYFISPHYPSNQSILRLGVSWNFFN